MVEKTIFVILNECEGSCLLQRIDFSVIAPCITLISYIPITIPLVEMT